MKRFTLFLWLTLFVQPLLAAGPWVCTRPGTRLEYVQRMGGDVVATQTKRVESAEGGEVVLRTEIQGVGAAERWTVTAEATTLRMEPPRELYEMLGSLGVERVECSGGDFAIPASPAPGDRLDGFSFSLSGELQGERMQVRVVADDCRAEAVERIETPAGAFDALRIVLRTTTYVTGMPPRAMVMTQWVARGVGLVRQEIPLPELETSLVQELTEIVNP